MSMLQILKLPDFITLMNALAGLLSIFFALENRLIIAGFLIIIAVAFDMVDGIIARRFNTSSSLGADLDSLADIISFGAAPVLFAYQLTKGEGIMSMIFMAIFILYLFAGIIRLARFNTLDMKGEYEGLPITVAGLLIPIICFLGFPHLLPYFMLLFAILMVSPFRFKKPFYKPPKADKKVKKKKTKK